MTRSSFDCLSRMIWLALLVTGCGSDEPVTATFVSPSYANLCSSQNCSGQGICAAEGASSGMHCVCNDGYAGELCERCEVGFHRDAKQRCAPDRHCVDQVMDPCGEHGECIDDGGVIACTCAQGYEGPRCMLCASGYTREADGAGDCRKDAP